MKTILTASLLGFTPQLADVFSLATGVSFILAFYIFWISAIFVLVEVRRV